MEPRIKFVGTITQIALPERSLGAYTDGGRPAQLLYQSGNFWSGLIVQKFLVEK